MIPRGEVTLRALRSLASTLFVPNHAVRIPCACVWRAADEARSARALAHRYGWAVVDTRGERRFPCDSYVGFGAPTLGSGRSIFVDDVQLKGVGRTRLAPLSGEPNSDGLLRPQRAVDEVIGSLLCRALLGVPPLPIAFVLLRERAGSEDAFLVGRRGSPLRVSHVWFLAGALECLAPAPRMMAWRRLLAEASRRKIDSARDVEAIADTMLEAALQLVADVRVLGWSLCNWPDNGDVFARVFDFEDLRFHGDRPGRAALPRPLRPRRGEPAYTYFSRSDFEVGGARPIVFGGALQSLVNTYRALDHLGAGVGYEPSLAERRDWEWLRPRYAAALTRSLARLVGERVPREAARLALAALPLVAGEGSIVATDAILDGVCAGVARRAPGRDVAHRIGHAIGARLSSSAGMRVERRRELLNAGSLRTLVAESRAEALRVERGRDRIDRYRALFARIAELFAPLG